MKPGTIVVVEWEDSATELNSLDWLPAFKLREALKMGSGATVCHSVGFLVYQGKRCISLAGNTASGGHVSHVIHIPMSAVRSVKKLVEK